MNLDLVDRGAWTFVPAQWYKLEQRLMLNTAGNLDGKIKILVNDELVVNLEDVNFREGKENRKILIIYKYI